MDVQTNHNRIAVGVDFSSTGDHALREAARLARQLPGSELHVIHVLRTEKQLHDAKKLEELELEMRGKVEQVRDHVADVCAGAKGYELEVTVHVRLGDPARALHQSAVDVDADLIVVGTHGRRGLDKLILGSVAEELMRMARLPVLIAHPKDFSDLPKTERPDPARPGDNLESTGISHRLHLSFPPRNAHVSGLY